MSGKRIWHWYGLDVSKDTFTASYYNGLDDIDTPPPVASFDISPEGVQAFLVWRSKRFWPEQADGIVMESTGPYSARLANLILAQEETARISICNPTSVRKYRESHTREKNDALDAVFIARYGFDSQPSAWNPGQKMRQRLRELVRQRDFYVQNAVGMENHAGTMLNEDDAKRDLENAKTLRAQVAEIECEMDEMIRKDLEAMEEVRIMAGMKGIGWISAVTFYAEFGSLKDYTRAELSAMSGVCPARNESGTLHGRGSITRHGPKEIRRILYLDSIAAVRCNPWFKTFYDRLLTGTGKSKKTARCACMRKILLTLRAMVISGKEFDPDYQNKKANRTEAKMDKGKIGASSPNTQKNRRKPA